MTVVLHIPADQNSRLLPVVPRDRDIRPALVSRLRAVHAQDPRTHIIDELPICQMRARADLAVINGEIIGFEIKSDVDRLTRLATQVGFYGRIFDRACVVAGPRHVDLLRRNLPRWWGIWVAESSGGGVQLFVEREAEVNESPSGSARAALLSRDEMAEVLVSRGANAEMRRARRAELQDALLSRLTSAEIGDAVRDVLRARPRGLTLADT